MADAVAANAMTMRSAFSDIAVTIDDLIAEDDKVAARVTFTAILGPLFGFPPTGRSAVVSALYLFTFVDDRVRTVVFEAGTFELLIGLGLLGGTRRPMRGLIVSANRAGLGVADLPFARQSLDRSALIGSTHTMSSLLIRPVSGLPLSLRTLNQENKVARVRDGVTRSPSACQPSCGKVPGRRHKKPSVRMATARPRSVEPHQKKRLRRCPVKLIVRSAGHIVGPWRADAGAHRDRLALLAVVDPEPVVDRGRRRGSR